MRLDGVLQSLPTVLAAIKSGLPIKQLGDPVIYEPLSVAVDQGDNEFSASIAEIVAELREDGALTSLSEKWYGADYTTTN